MNRAFASLLGSIVCLTGCVIQTAGPTEHDYKVVERDNADSLVANVTMGAGSLRIGSGTEKLVRADFDYNVPAWKPEFQYTSGSLTIRQPSQHGPHIGNSRYDWDLRFNRDVPLDLHINFGAGQAHLDLGGLNLRRVGVEMGVGTINMDLRGPVKRDCDVSIQGGVGEAIVYLPADTGVYAEASGGIGDIRVQGLQRDGSHYFNDAYHKSKYTIHVNVQGGVGSIHLISD